MTFAENIKRICAEKGTNLTAVVKKVEGSSSFVTAINKGSLPKESELLEFAKELGCSVMDFFANEEDLVPQPKPQNEDEQDILKIYRSLSRRAKHEFMSMVYEFENRKELEGVMDQLRHSKVIPFDLIKRKKQLEVVLRKR